MFRAKYWMDIHSVGDFSGVNVFLDVHGKKAGLWLLIVVAVQKIICCAMGMVSGSIVKSMCLLSLICDN